MQLHVWTIKVIICCSTSHVDLLDVPILILRPYFFLLYHAALPGVSVWSRSNSWELSWSNTALLCAKNLKQIYPYSSSWVLARVWSLYLPPSPWQSLPFWKQKCWMAMTTAATLTSVFNSQLQTWQESLTPLGIMREAPQWWGAGKEHSSTDISSESKAKVLWTNGGSVRYYCCGTANFSFKNGLKSDLSVVSNNCPLQTIIKYCMWAPSALVFLNMRRLKEGSHPLFFISSFISWRLLCLLTLLGQQDTPTLTCTHTPAALITCWGGCDTQEIRVQRVPLCSGRCFWFRASYT